jgi:hypothetical protein
MRSYMKALDAQLDLIRLWKGRYGPALASYWVDMLRGEDDGGPSLDLGTKEQFAAREAYNLDRADTYWVTPTMVDMIDEQRQRLPSYELRASDIPSRRGFCLLAHPIYIVDRHGKRCNITAFSWETEVMIMAAQGTRPAPISQAEAEQAYALDYEPREGAVEEDAAVIQTPVVVREDGSSLAKAVRFFVYSDKWDPNDEGWGEDDASVLEAKSASPDKLSLFHVQTWMLNQRIPDPDDPHLLGSESFLRIVATFWTLCNQKIVITPSMGLDRVVRKRAMRANGPANDIKVVMLRREYDHDTWDRPRGDGEGRGYSHSFWVRGHLRNQWYPSEGRHKPKWIDAFVKGGGNPDEKDTVIVLGR